MSFKSKFKKFIFKIAVALLRVQVVNPEKEPESGVLVCSNHIANMDPVMIVTSFKRPVYFMAKKELFKIPVLGWFIKLFGAFPVDRGSVDLNAMKKAISLLTEGTSVGMFPQGTRYSGKDPRDSKVKSGAGMIVCRSQTDVLPVAIVTKKNKFSLFSQKYIVLGDVIKYDSLGNSEKTREEFDRISGVIFSRICDLHEKYSYLTEKNTKETSKE